MEGSQKKIPSNQLVYYAPRNRQSFAVNMIQFGAQVFMSARHIKELDKLREVINAMDQLILNEENRSYISYLALDTIIDWTRITICFENFMKASLLLNGFLIHKISHKETKTKPLSSSQSKRPIPVKEFTTIQPFIIKDGEEHYSLPGLLNQSLTFSTLLRPKYQEVINLPQSVLETITRINTQRNNLHFYHEAKNSYSQEMIEELEELKVFVQRDMMGLYGYLKNHLGNHNMKF